MVDLVPHEGLPLRPRRQRQGARRRRSRPSSPTRPRSARARWSRRWPRADDAPDGEVLRGGHPRRSDDPGAGPEARRSRSARSSRSRCGSALPRHRQLGAARLPASTSLPSPADRGRIRRRTSAASRSTLDGRSRRRRSRPGLQDAHRSLRRPISILRVVSGTLHSDAHALERHAPRRPERARHLHPAPGQAGHARPPKLHRRRHRRGRQAQGDAHRRHPRRQGAARSRLAWIHVPEPAIAFAIEPKSKGDEEKIGDALHRLIEEDPTLARRRDPQTNEFLLSGSGQLHVEIAVARLKKRYGVEVILHPPKVPYRETITASAEATAGTRSRPAAAASSPTAGSASSRCRAATTSSSSTRSSAASIPQQLPPGGREGHPGGAAARLPRRLPDGRLPGAPARRPVPRRRLLGAGVQDRRLARLQGGHGEGRADAARAGDEGRDPHHRGVHGRHHGRPLAPPRPARRAWTPRTAVQVIKAQVPMAEMLELRAGPARR